MQRTLKEMKAQVSQVGLKLLEFTYTGQGHGKGLIQAKDGATMVLTQPSSNGDWRAVRNRMSILKRFAHEHGSFLEKGCTRRDARKLLRT